jgi:uncharacterized protein (DUF2267 family)
MGHEINDVFEGTLQKSNEWIQELMDELGWGDAHHALGALRAVVHTIRDRLPVHEAAALAADMPAFIRGIYYEDWQPLEHVPVLRHRGELLAHLEERLGGAYGLHGEETMSHVAGSVLRVLRRHVSLGETDEGRAVLPADLRVFWPGVSATAGKPARTT